MTVLQELDTISDFVTYLCDKESWVGCEVKSVLHASEEDLLALYLRKGRTFPKGYGVILVDDTLWEGLADTSEYKAKKLADRDSYIWDNLIETFCKDTLNGNLEQALDGGFEFTSSLSRAEIAIRTMAREDRFSRRILGKCFREFLQRSAQRRVRSRMVESPSGVLYVFLAVPHEEERVPRVAELGNRCFVARGLHQDCKTVVGIATQRHEPGKGFSLDLVYLHKDVWTDDDRACAEAMQKDLGYFVNVQEKRVREDEYPAGRAL